MLTHVLTMVLTLLHGFLPFFSEAHSQTGMNSELLDLLKEYSDDGLEGDVELLFTCTREESEPVRVHSSLLSLASPVLRGAFDACTSSSSPHKIAVEESREAWLCVLSRLYPLHPRQELTIELTRMMMPICHKYNIASVRSEALLYLSRELPSALHHKVDSPGYIFTWLQLADNLELQDIHKLCLRKIRDLARFKLLDSAAFLSIPTQSPISKPNFCQQQGTNYSLSSQSGHTYGECVRWCGKCKRWQCGKAACNSCGTTPTQTEAAAIWFIDDEPDLQPGVRALSRETLEQVLSIVIAVNSESYVHEERPGESSKVSV
jgi:hypothetical protein